MMGPPIRIGFDGGSPQDHAAPVSNGYHAQTYTPPHGGAGPYPSSGPYQGYPAAGHPHAAGPASFDPYLNHGGRSHGRGGYNSIAGRGRSQFGGDKMRHKKPGGSVPTPNTHHQKPDAASAGKKKKRKTNTLGLTPGEESDEDDADEEARLLELVGPDAPK